MLQQPIIVIGGPTASGKSHLATVIAKKHDGVIINGDSMQIYREIPIISAQPSEKERLDVPHALYGALPASESCSVAKWLKMVFPLIDKAHAESKSPVIVGGTGLYLKSLVYGISPIPDVDPEIRKKIMEQKESLGNQNFHEKLRTVDPVMAERLHPNDSQRMTRAMEVLEQTGVSLADWQKKPLIQRYNPESFKTFFVNPPREQLYQQCDARFLAMLENGALDEIRTLDALNLAPSLPSMKALGVPELLQFLHEKSSLDGAIAAAQQSTRNYAKRQVTWFNHQFNDASIVSYDSKEAAEEVILSELSQFLLTP